MADQGLILGTPWVVLDTPRMLVDETLLRENIVAFHAAVLDHGVAMRSHVKTHKTPAIARLQLAAGAAGIAAAKVSEAEVFVEAGIEDVVVAYPVFGVQKWARLAELATRAQVAVHVENRSAVRGLSEAAVARGVQLRVRVEVDSGFHRSGVTGDRVAGLAREVIDAAGLHFDGITSHRSMFFEDNAGRHPFELGIEEGRLMVAVADGLRAEGIPVPQVVAGSTPTGAGVASVPGITEVCAGTYPFYDAGMADLGVVEFERCALSVLTTVVAVTGEHRYTVDAGAKTLSKENYPHRSDLEPVFGRMVGRDDVVVALTDEHGICRATGEPPSVGEVIRVVPMHVCPAVNLADEVVIVCGGVVVDLWPVTARGSNR